MHGLSLYRYRLINGEKFLGCWKRKEFNAEDAESAEYAEKRNPRGWLKSRRYIEELGEEAKSKSARHGRRPLRGAELVVGGGAEFFAQGGVAGERFFDDVHGGVGGADVFDLDLFAFELLVVREKTLEDQQSAIVCGIEDRGVNDAVDLEEAGGFVEFVFDVGAEGNFDDGLEIAREFLAGGYVVPCMHHAGIPRS